MNKQIIPICFQNKYKIMIPLSDSWSSESTCTQTRERKTKIQIRIPHSSLLKPAPTDLYAEIRGGFQKMTNNKDLIMRISRISQYIEVKSEKILKIYQEIVGFHRYILKYPQKQDEYHT